MAAGRRMRFWLFLLVILLLVLGIHPLLAWLAERAATRVFSTILIAPPETTSIDVDFSQHRLRLDGVSLNAPGHPGAVKIARIDSLQRLRNLWADEIVMPQVVEHRLELELPAAAGVVRAGSDHAPGSGYWTQVAIGNVTVGNVTLEAEFGGSSARRGRLRVERVDLDNVRLSRSATPPPRGTDWLCDACLLTHATATLIDRGVDPPLVHYVSVAALDLDRVHYPASGPDVLWPIKGGGDISAGREKGGYYLSGGFNRTARDTNFTLRIDLNKLSLAPYSPYLERPLQYGYLTMTLHAQCRRDRLTADAAGEFTRLWFKPVGVDSRIFGLTEKSVLDLLLSQGNRLEFHQLHIGGQLSDPRIDWGESLPVGLEYVLERALRAALQLPQELGMLVLDTITQGASREEIRDNLRKSNQEEQERNLLAPKLEEEPK